MEQAECTTCAACTLGGWMIFLKVQDGSCETWSWIRCGLPLKWPQTFKIFKSWVNALKRSEREREGRDINKKDYIWLYERVNKAMMFIISARSNGFWFLIWLDLSWERILNILYGTLPKLNGSVVIISNWIVTASSVFLKDPPKTNDH